MFFFYIYSMHLQKYSLNSLSVYILRTKQTIIMIESIFPFCVIAMKMYHTGEKIQSIILQLYATYNVFRPLTKHAAYTLQ